MKGQRRHDKRAGVQGAPQIVIFIWYTTDDYTGPQHEARRHTPLCCIVSVSMWREGVRPSPLCRPNLTWRGGHGPSLSCLCPKDVARRVYPSPSHHSHFNVTRWGMPLLVVSSFQSRHDKEGFPPLHRVKEGNVPPRHVILPVSKQRGGACPSSSCLHSNPNTARRVCPLPIASFPFRRVEEGNVPPHHVVLPVSKRQGGACPSSLCHCHFDASRRAMPLPVASSFQFQSGEGS